MKIKFKIVATFAFVFFTVSSCDTLMQMASFVNCKYELGNLSNPGIAGIKLDNVTGVENLNAASILKLTAAILAGSLPMSVDVNIKATNPNSTQAKMAGLEWALDLDNSNLLTGMVDRPISVPANGGQATIPFNIQMDVMKLLQGQSKDNIFNFVNNLLNVGESSSRVSLRIKPSIMVGNQAIQTGFITVHKTVK